MAVDSGGTPEQARAMNNNEPKSTIKDVIMGEMDQGKEHGNGRNQKKCNDGFTMVVHHKICCAAIASKGLAAAKWHNQDYIGCEYRMRLPVHLH